MKKTILVVLTAVMIATPCLAEVEPAGLFGVEGTRWGSCGIGFSPYFPFVVLGCSSHTLGFYKGTVYMCTSTNYCYPQSEHSYVDLLAVSILTGIYSSENYGWFISLGIMQPIGFGIYTACGYHKVSPVGQKRLYYSMGIMFKVEDDWEPTDVE